MDERRKNLAINAYMDGEIDLTELPLVLSIVATLEQGEHLVDVIADMEKMADKHGAIEKLDHASSWIRSKVDKLNLSF